MAHLVSSLEVRTHARRPGDLGTESRQSLNKNGSLDGPMRDDVRVRWGYNHGEAAYMWRHPAIRAPFKGC